MIKLHGGTLDIESVTAGESKDGSRMSPSVAACFTLIVRWIHFPMSNTAGSLSRSSWITLIIRLGADHLPRDAIESNNTDVVQSAYGKGIVDEAMQWNRDRESSSVDSSSDSGALSSADTSSKSSRGLDPSTLYFKKEDVIMLVDGEFPSNQLCSRTNGRFV